ncbi:MAG: Uma2 family endonuclease [Steroidobacteraceae bacterium]
MGHKACKSTGKFRVWIVDFKCGLCGAPDWVAEVLSPSTARRPNHPAPASERAGVREIRPIDPTDGTVAIYRLAAGHCSRPAVLELTGRTAITTVPGVSIDWDQVVAALSPALPG